MKQIILNQLSLALCLILNMSAYAVSTTIDGIQYELNLNNRTAAVSSSTLANVIVPATIINDGITFTVTHIQSEAFENNKIIRTFKAPNTIRTIGNFAFEDASNLMKVDIGNAVETIDDRAFYRCSSLKYIVIPATIKSIGYGAFYGCDQLNIICLNPSLNTGYSNQTIYPSSFFTFYYNSIKYNGRVPEVGYTFNGIGSGFEPTNVDMSQLEKEVGRYETYIWCTLANEDMSFTVAIPYSYTIKPVTLTARVKDATKVYGDTNPQFQTEYTGFITGEDESVITSMGTYSTSATASSAVGTYNVTQSGAVAQNYTFQYEPGTLTVTKAPLTMTPRNKTMTYGDRMPTLEVDYAGLKNNESKPAWVTEPSITTTATSASNAGTYPITISGGEAKNYDVIFNQGTLTINKAALTATTKNATRVYGNENPDFEMTYSGLKNNETAPVWAIAPSFASPATKTSPVGTYGITATGGEARNYVVQFVNTGKLTVTKAPLTAKARNYTRRQGEENPSFAVDYTGFKNGETKLALTQEPIATTTATRNSRPGTYEITLSGGVAMNYDIEYVSGTLTILPSDAPGDDTNNTLSVGNVKGAKNTKVTLPIAMKNKQQITGLQFDLYLPAGVTVATNERGRLVISTTSRMDGNYALTGSVMDGFVRIAGYSPDTDPFLGSDGDILEITLDISNSIADGDYTIRLKDIVLSDVNNTEYHPADVGGVLTISNYTPGDVDNSGAVNINDVVCIINYILNKANGTFIEAAADVDGSGVININDVVTLINRYILHRNSAPRRTAAAAAYATTSNADRLFIDSLSIQPGETMEIEMQLANDNEVRAVQGNIKLPAGFSFATKASGKPDVKNLDERCEDFTLSCAIQEDGSLTFAHYSAYGDAYEGHNGGIFTFKIVADSEVEPGDYDVNLSDVVLSINGVGYEMPDLVTPLTVQEYIEPPIPDDIQLLQSDTLFDIYTIAGTKVRSNATSIDNLPRGIYIVNGQKVIIR